MSSPVKSLQSRNPEKTRARLLRAGIKLFSEKGYHGVSVSMIVNRAGVTKRMLYHYYGNKEGLYLAVLRDVFARLEKLELAALDESLTLKEAVRLVLHQYFEFLHDEPEFVSLLMWENLDRGRFLSAHPNLLTKTPALQRLGVLLKRYRKNGELSYAVDPQHLLVLLSAIGFIYHSNRHTIPHTIGLDIAQESVRRHGLHQAEKIVLEGLLAR